MCGINGLIKSDSSEEELKVILERMNRKIIHRGPDDDGFYTASFNQNRLGMAMRRLAVIDPETGKQPIFSDDGHKVIVFNGEIYNFKKLREILISKGYFFGTASDTEVIVNLYDCYGTACFSMLDGAFGLAIFDSILNKVFIARDYFGEKPLYYFKNQNQIIWASELKSIIEVVDFKPGIDREALNLYFQLTYIPAPYTIFKEIRKLEANHFLEISLENQEIKKHEITQNFEKYDQISKTEAISITHNKVMESVASRSVSDVKIGTFLSGGVDSSIVSLCLAKQTDSKIDTFSIGFENKSFDETDKSQTVANLIGSNHHEFIITEKDLEQDLSKILLNFDEPFADSSALASYLVASRTKQFASVALTGDGGDEVFGGYNKYYIGKLNQKYTGIIPEFAHKSFSALISPFLKASTDKRGKRLRLRKLIESIDYDGDFYYKIISLGFQEEELKEIIQSGWLTENVLDYYKNKMGGRNSSLNDFREIDRFLSLEGDMLVKSDRTSMLASLECRAPLLNKELWNFTGQLPESYLISGWDKKHLLKEAFKSYFPDGFLDKSKRGFGVPVGDWLRTTLKEELLIFSDKEFLKSQAIFNYEPVSKLINDHLSGKADNTFRVWTFYCFQKWYLNFWERTA